METACLRILFTNVQPFRRTLLQLLSPYDIAKFLVAIRCDISKRERETYMNILDELLEDTRDFELMKELSWTVLIFGSDLNILQGRLSDPLTYLAEYQAERVFNIFVVVTKQTKENETTLLQDFRPTAFQHLVPESCTDLELRSDFPPRTAEAIASLSKWTLCAPHIVGSVPISTPGWIPVLKGRKHINIHTYFPVFNSSKSRILYMSRAQVWQAIGDHGGIDLFSAIRQSKPRCLVMKKAVTHSLELRPRLILNTLRDVFVSDRFQQGSVGSKLVVLHAIHPTIASVALELDCH
ncbi:hypothetical protein EJ04DRAFT_557818 [Polyplosphaeria fusca]|uniref:Uncharacterized protein n=1 Tax=Polyplosphaeria fusca TaxID=682080 RepID=A0A9P4QKS8_9PLEO|nr:hypothetical protein EJ04DRAFT_557818 [Polyplosphaeria fusca]